MLPCLNQQLQVHLDDTVLNKHGALLIGRIHLRLAPGHCLRMQRLTILRAHPNNAGAEADSEKGAEHVDQA